MMTAKIVRLVFFLSNIINLKFEGNKTYNWLNRTIKLISICVTFRCLYIKTNTDNNTENVLQNGW